jgi:hypothetical protein
MVKREIIYPETGNFDRANRPNQEIETAIVRVRSLEIPGHHRG